MSPRIAVQFVLNGKRIAAEIEPLARLSDVLRQQFGCLGVKSGCTTGACGVCTILLDGVQACACLTPAAHADGKLVITVEGLTSQFGVLSRVQQAFQRHGALQCGYCTAGMLIAATEVVAAKQQPSEAEVLEALSGVLCRCTGYRQVVAATLDAHAVGLAAAPPVGSAVGAAAPRLDALPKLTGQQRFAADLLPADALVLHIVRAAVAPARFRLGDLAAFAARHPGLSLVLVAADLPRASMLADQALAYVGQPILALVGEPELLALGPPADLPLDYEVTPPPPTGPLAARWLETGQPSTAEAHATVEHTVRLAAASTASLEPLSGLARRLGDRLEMTLPAADAIGVREAVAAALDLPCEAIDIVAASCCGRFGASAGEARELAVLLAVAAWRLRRPVAHIAPPAAAGGEEPSTTIHARASADADGRLLSFQLATEHRLGPVGWTSQADLDHFLSQTTLAYPARHVRLSARAAAANCRPGGAHRGLDASQVVIATEAAIDALATRLELDPLSYRLSLVAPDGALRQCLQALRRPWHRAMTEAATHNATASATRRGVGLAAVRFHLPRPTAEGSSRVSLSLGADGSLVLRHGLCDLGQGSATVLAQVAADALRLPADAIAVSALPRPCQGLDTASAARAVALAAASLLATLRQHAKAPAHATIEFAGNHLHLADAGIVRLLDLSRLPRQPDGAVLSAEAVAEPATPCTVAAAQLAEVSVDLELGTVRVLNVVAAQEVGCALNPALVEAQILGGIAQGIGHALLGRRAEGAGGHLPTVADMPAVVVIPIVAGASPSLADAKPVGAIGGIATPAAILCAVRRATGRDVPMVPATPERVLGQLL